MGVLDAIMPCEDRNELESAAKKNMTYTASRNRVRMRERYATTATDIE